jgi:hypothetical protein
MLQTGMILQCRNSAKKQEDFQTLHYVTHYTVVIKANSIPFLYQKTVLDTALLIKMLKLFKQQQAFKLTPSSLSYDHFKSWNLRVKGRK